MKYYKFLIKYSHLNIAGNKRVVSEKEVTAFTEKAARNEIKYGGARVGARLNIRILKVTKIGTYGK
jgi:hypothetical protein